jgi:NhaP-type Na+/H+ or K+/H+ antiporter
MNKGNLVYLYVIFALLIIYTLVLGYYDRYKPKFGTPPAIMLVLSALFSVVYFQIHGETYADYEEFKFPPGIYWNLLVPMLIFNGAFHLKRESYLPNLGNSIIIA